MGKKPAISHEVKDEVERIEEWFFPGSGLVDGTVERALKAGIEAYE